MTDYPEDGHVRREYLVGALKEKLNKVPNGGITRRDDSQRRQQFERAMHELQTLLALQLGEPLESRKEICDAVREITELSKSCVTMTITDPSYETVLVKVISEWHDHTLSIESIL